MTVLPLAASSKNSTSNMAELKKCFAEVIKEFDASPAKARIVSGKFTQKHYKEYLKQLYFYARESSQLLTLAAVHFRGSDRNLVNTFLKHAREEWGHDQWALNDLAVLGVDVDNIPYENPLPRTLALIAFTFYQITWRNPISHLGYVFFLEFLVTQDGSQYTSLYEKAGIPKNAMTFVSEHVAFDEHHNKLMERYAEELIHDEADLEAVKYSMRVTAKLYADMVLGAIEEADNPQDWGVCHEELERKVGDGKLRYEPE